MNKALASGQISGKENKMTVRECYNKMGADYEGVMSRLGKEERVQRFLIKFLDDQSYALLCSSLKERNMEEAFRAAHSLKGVSLNLSLTNLYVPASRLSDRLKQQREYSEEVQLYFEEVTREYQRTTEYIHELS